MSDEWWLEMLCNVKCDDPTLIKTLVLGADAVAALRHRLRPDAASQPQISPHVHYQRLALTPLVNTLVRHSAWILNMSGIEAIGLVLGAFPLAISALEHWREAAKVINVLENFDNEWSKTLNDIKDEYLDYQLNLKILLLPLVHDDKLDEAKLDLLLADSSHEDWHSNDLDPALRARLDIAHARFMETMQSLQQLVWELLILLGVDKPGIQARLRAETPATQSRTHPRTRLQGSALREMLRTSLEYRKEQLKFGFNQSRRDELLKDIHSRNDTLYRFLQKSEVVARLHNPAITSIGSKAVKSLLHYWKDADMVYDLIHRSWGCQCLEKHCAHLWLQHRTESLFEFTLLVLWSSQCTLAQSCSPWTSQGLRITRLEGLSPSTLHTAGTGIATLTPAVKTGGSRTTPNSRGNRPGADVGLHMTALIADVVHPGPSRLIHLPITPAHSDSASNISELCVAMVTCSKSPACIGALIDVEKGKKYSVESRPEQEFTAQGVTLQEILSTSPKPRLKRSDRYRIALDVASSHLQLQSTAWARKQWEAQDIQFPSGSVGPSDIMFDRPYVSANFNVGHSKISSAGHTRYKSFACLGIMLMELLFGVSLEAHDLWSSPGFGGKQSTPLFRQMVAREWADAVEGEAGPKMSAAIMWCLNESPTTLDGDQWRQDLAHKVVLPLQNCCDWIQSKPAH
ncbi:hypothetical protein LTR42_010731 [Elasticomyces elasticus]|nr:hypothetical protein LTR42_010731 [Elasticomyces elasticus]